MLDLTEHDKADLTEGIKKRPDHKWKRQAKLSIDQKLEVELVDSGGHDIWRIAKKYEKTTEEVIQVCKTLGLY